MKKGWKIFWIVCAIAAGIGIMCCMIAFTLGVTTEAIASRLPNGIGIKRGTEVEIFDDRDYDDEDHVGNLSNAEAFSKGSIWEVDVEIPAGNLQVLVSDTDEIKLDMSELDASITPSYYEDEGELVIKGEKSLKGLVNAEDAGTIYLYLPKDYSLDEVSFQIGAGRLYIEDIETNSLDIEVGAGNAEIAAFHAGEVDLKCGAGKITATGGADRELDIDCGIGEVNLSMNGLKEDYSYEIQSGVGKVQIGDETFSGLGERKKLNHNTGKEINVDCGAGSITINFVN